MRSVLFVSHFFWPHVGGVERHIEKLIPELTERGYTLTILTSQHDSRLPLQETHGSATIIRLPLNQIKSKVGTWLAILKHWRLFVKNDIIHIHDVFWWIFPVYPLIFHKVFMTFHGYERDQGPTFKQIFWHRVAAWLSRGNICIGDFHKKWYGVAPTAVSYGAVDTSLFKQKLPKKNPFNISFIGRLATDTSISTYLHAFRLLYQQDQRYAMEVYGDGPLSDKLTSYAQEHHLPVTFHGFLPNAVAKSNASGVACVSQYLAILESMALQIPVVATYQHQFKHDYLSMAPFAHWISITKSPQEIVEAIKHPTHYSKTATEWIRQQTWTKVADTYEKLWKR